VTLLSLSRDLFAAVFDEALDLVCRDERDVAGDRPLERRRRRGVLEGVRNVVTLESAGDERPREGVAGADRVDGVGLVGVVVVDDAVVPADRALRAASDDDGREVVLRAELVRELARIALEPGTVRASRAAITRTSIPGNSFVSVSLASSGDQSLRR